MQSGEEYLSFSSSVLRPAATVPSLASGPNTVTIDPRVWSSGTGFLLRRR